MIGRAHKEVICRNWKRVWLHGGPFKCSLEGGELGNKYSKQVFSVLWFQITGYLMMTQLPVFFFSLIVPFCQRLQFLEIASKVAIKVAINSIPCPLPTNSYWAGPWSGVVLWMGLIFGACLECVTSAGCFLQVLPCFFVIPWYFQGRIDPVLFTLSLQRLAQSQAWKWCAFLVE